MAYRILIVDDSSIVRKVLIKTLGMTPLAVGELLQAENGQEALTILKDHWVDLVFLDINMPVMNGVTFLQNLRAEPTTRDIPVIIVSTEGSNERVATLQELGAKAYLRKPVTPEVLASTVEAVLGGLPHE